MPDKDKNYQFPNDPKPYQLLESKYLFTQPPWLVMREDRLKVPDGGIIEKYWVWEYPAWVNVIAITERNEIVLIRQYRYALGKVYFEIPAGTIDPGETNLESAARRELLEETGYGEGTWELFMTLSANPALQNNLTYTFLAKGVRKISEQKLESTEDIQVHLMPVDELKEILFNEGFIQALHTAPLLKYLLMREQGN
ncbi:MAG: NUDIX hydrolase [Chloroherpetonaceae bacterium]|nr:NUDIX hydrolase [Chloroherpetonaceae bacterium]